MAGIRIEGCTVDDGPAVARNNFPAFWEDESWRLIWRRRSLDYVVAEGQKRLPYNLLSDQQHLRHLKAVDAATGDLLGYCRFKLPDIPGVDEMWPEARVPDVSDERRKELQTLHASATWDWEDTNIDETRHHQQRAKLMAGQPWLYIDYLAVHPRNQRRGIGVALVSAGLVAGDRLGLDTFVTAFAMGVSTYRRLGFEEMAATTMNDASAGGPGDYTYTLMRKLRSAPQ